MTTDADFDPTLPCPARPTRGPRPTRRPALRAAVPHDRHDRGRTGHRPPDPRAPGGRRRAGGGARDGHRRPRRAAGAPIVVTGCGTSEHAALGRGRDPARGGPRRRPAGSRTGRRAGVRAVPRPARRRPRHRRVARGRDGRHERGPRRCPGRRRPDGAPDRHRRVAGRGARRPRRRDRRAGPELVPHRRLHEPDAGGGRGRGAPVGPSARRRGGRRRSWRAAQRDETGAERIAGRFADAGASPRRRLRRRSAGRPRARSRSRRRPGCRRRTATSRRSCTATCPATGPETALVLILTDRDRPSRAARPSRQALAGGAGHRHPVGGDPGGRPRSASSIPAPDPGRPAPRRRGAGAAGAGRRVVRDGHAAPAPDRAAGPRPRHEPGPDPPRRPDATAAADAAERLSGPAADPDLERRRGLDLADERLAHARRSCRGPRAGSPGA